MKKVECKNPKVTELKKGDDYRRHINASSFKKIEKNGLKYCAWCGEGRVTGNRKYCTDACRDNCYAFIHPQKEFGLEYHLQTQDFKCADCKFDYKPAMDKINAQYAKRNYVGWDENRESAVPYFFKRLKTRVEYEYGKGKKPEVDHIVPIALGGDVVGFDNHQVLCHDCHKCKTKLDVSAIAIKRKEDMARESSINEQLSLLDVHKDKECVRCERKYPETILNIEGTIHHNCRMMCLDKKDCNKYLKKLRKSRKK